MGSLIQDNIGKLFTPNSDRRAYAARFNKHLHRQARALHIPAALIFLFAWLGFAFETDARLHPEFPELFYFRIGMSITAALLGLAIISDALRITKNLRGEGHIWIYGITAYLVLSTSAFTGRIADDPNYVSGLQIVIMLVVLAPLSLRVMFGVFTLSLIFFVAGILLYQPALDTDAARYSMQNISLAYVACFVMSFILDRIRFKVFINNIKVSEKSQELRTQIEQVRTLKEQQDGDYFLTSNLIKPLLASLADHPNVKVDFLLHQKKKFKFRKWESEIGGDFITAHTITLKGETYTAFVNGDAMGKSIQGAGGALVLGTAFRSLITRTQIMPEAADKYPEQWLKDCFIELQNIFVTFDGSMLISAVLGLVNNQSGLLYYINAEHPWTVLYRKGQAQFIENELGHHKIGVLESEGQMQVKIHQIQPGDVILVGSDGRDDILLGLDDQGNRILNEDETLFLKHVKAGHGQLEEIYKSLLKTGELTDDLSLLGITFRGTSSDNPAPLRKLVKSHHSAGRYALAAECSVTLAKQSPSETPLLYQVARLYKKNYIQTRELHCLEIAAEFGERYRIREPRQTHNLTNLADIYRLRKNYPRARMLLELVFQMEPDNIKAQRLSELLP